ncbi:MAG: glutamate-1-semialdehyde 2,1-aminomutase, partial [Bdellovibrionota bacterium]
GQPLLASRGEGPYLWDADGNRYIDTVMSYGPHLFGHAHAKITEAVTSALKNSSCLGMSSEGEIEWAELLLKRFPNAQKVRAMSTGTEACATAIRLARGYTKRDKILKFSGHYHGHVDSLMVAAGSGLATLAEASNPVPDSAGIPVALTSLAVVAEFNNTKLLAEIFKSHGKDLACAILEPVMGNMGVIPPDPAFLKELRELTRIHGCVLIFDEVMTGLRVGARSAQGLYGVDPDLTTLGKIVGGGLPLSALAGPSEIMDKLAPLGPVYQAGTLSGNPLCVAAGIAMMKLIDAEEPYARLETFGAKIQTVIETEASRAKLPVRVERVGSMISVFFRKEALMNDQDALATDAALFNQYFWNMLEEGFMLPPSPYEACFLAVPHTQLGDDVWAQGIKRVFERIRPA